VEGKNTKRAVGTFRAVVHSLKDKEKNMETEVITQNEPETEKPEPEAPETEQARRDAEPEVAVAVGLALMKDRFDRGENAVCDYSIALGESTLGRSFMDELTNSFNPPDWLAKDIVRDVLLASGHPVDDSTDVAPLVAIVQKTVKEWNDSEDTAQCTFAGQMFVAGRLSAKAESR
jgi:hypothetical protein